MVPEKDRLKPGAAALVHYFSLFKGISEVDSRRIRISATLTLGFLRVVARSAWQTVTIPLLVEKFGFTTWDASIVFSCVTL